MVHQTLTEDNDWEYKLADEYKRVNLGSGKMPRKGWINVDLYEEGADVKCDCRALSFEDNSIDEIYCGHVIEHFHFRDGAKVLKECYRVLKVGGKFTIETPDLMETCKKFISCTEKERIESLYPHMFGMPWIDGGAHYFLYSPTQMNWSLRQVGFREITKIFAARIIDKEDICMAFKCLK